MFLLPLQLEAPTALLPASPHKVLKKFALCDPANLRDENVPNAG